MPPEASPCWDRKDFFFRERKHERSDSFAPVARWRDSSSSSYNHHHHRSRDFARWGSASDFRRPPPGHGKQGGWHMYSKEMVHGYAPSRSSERMVDEDSYRPSLRNGDVKYGRGSRDNRGGSYYSQKDWKSHPWETGNGSPSPSAGRHFVMGNEQRPSGDMMRYNSHPPHSGAVNGWDQGHFKERPDKFVGANELGANHRYERENSLGSNHWKRLKWARAGCLTSRGSGYSHSSSSKSAGADSSEAKPELQPRRATPTQSASGDAVTCVTSAAPYEEASSRKKPRLGWGEGLAKFEKKVVDPDEGPSANGVASPRGLDYLDCASPTTPSSIACSFSPGMDNKACVRGPNMENETSNLIGAPGAGFLNHLEGFSLNLKNLDANTIATIGSSLIEFLQSDELAASDPNFMRFTAMNNLLKWKGNISKILEMTESEIDSLENEFNLLKAPFGSLGSSSAVPSSLDVEGITPLIDEKGIASSLIHRPTRLQLESSKDMIVSMTLCESGAKIRDEAKDEEIDSPGSATSKLIEPSTSQKKAPLSDIVKHVECPGGTSSISTEVAHNVDMENANIFACANDKLIEGSASASASTEVNLCSDVDAVSLCDLILSSNRELAYRAHEVFNELLPVGKCQSDNHEAANISSWKNDSCITENFARRKRFVRFKERVITLKYRAFQHLWKEDIRLLSIRKNRVKSLKRFELSARVSHSGLQKHRSPLLSRFYSPAGNSSLVPTTEMINFTSKLLSDSQVKLCRNTLKMPALILDNKDKSASRFLSNNGLVEDPHAIEKERTLINPWTSEEKKIFMDNLATFGKDFNKIASFLDHKTTADCVEFYYKNHKSDSFEKTKKHPEITKQGKLFSANNYLLTSGKKWNRDMNAASLHILGAASVIAAHADVGKKPYESDLETSNALLMLGKERETAAAADVLAGICGSLSSEAMGSCITSSVDPGEGYQDWKYKKVGSSRKRPLTPEVTQFVDDEETCSDDSCGEMDPSDWTDEEKSVFIQAIASYGRDFARISRRVRTRSTDQCKIFYSKARKCLGLDMLHPVSINAGTSFSDDCNGGGSGTEDACVVEAGSSVLPLSVVNTSHDESVLEGTNCLQINMNRSEENTGTEAEHTVPEMVDNSVVDECLLEGNLEQLISDGEKNSVKDVEGKSLLLRDQKDAVISTGSKVGSDQPGVVALSSGKTKPDAIVDLKFVVEPVHGMKAEGEGREVLLSENCNDKEDISNVETIGQSILACSIVDMDVNRNAPLVAADIAPVKSDVSTNLQHHSLMELDSNQNSLLTEVYVSKDSDVRSDKPPSQNFSSSNYGWEVNPCNQYKKLKCVDDQYQHLEVHTISNHAESSQILRGYPLQLSTKNEMNGNINGQTSVVPVQRYIAQECYIQKCNSSKPHSSVSELHLLAQNEEQKNHHHRPKSSHLRSSSDPEKQCNIGDFKLFGQILSHQQPSLQKVNSVTQEKDNPNLHPKSSCNSLNLKFSSHQNIDELSKIDRNNYLGNENFVSRTYGFWDGNRIQTGFSAVPDSILRAKYPTSFSYPSSTSTKLDLQSVVVKSSNESNLNGLTVFPTMESSRNGVTDFQVFRGNKLQAMKQNGFDGFSSVQHQGRGIVGMNVLGRAGILVGGPCPPAVSDPVAAIQMHYAKKAEQYGGSIIGDEESWRSKGDIGR